MKPSLPSYEEDYHRAVHGRLIDDPLYYDLKAREAERDLFAGIDSEARVFEFGVGLGKNIVRRRHRDGYDASRFAREFSRQKGIHVFDSAEEVPDAAYDVVLSSHVLEHLEDPFANLRWLGTKLKPHGKLLLVLPVERDRKRTLPLAEDVDQHLYAWSMQTIRNLLERSGYRVVSQRFRYATAQYKLRHVGQLSFELYSLQTKALGRLLKRRDMVIVAEKSVVSAAR